MPRVVLDTNVIISGILWKGKPRQLLKKGLSREFILVILTDILIEVIRVLKDYFGLPDHRIFSGFCFWENAVKSLILPVG